MPVNLGALSGADEPKPEDVPAAAAETSDERPAKKSRRTKKQMIADAVIPADDKVVEIKMNNTDAKVERPWIEAVQLVRDDKAGFVDKGHHYALLKLMDQQREQSGSDQSDVDAWVQIQRQLDEDPDNKDLIQQSDALRVRIMEAGGQDPATDEAYMARAEADLGNAPSGQFKAPDEAEIGDLVIHGGVEYTVGHGHVLKVGPVGTAEGNVISPNHRWEFDESAQLWSATDVKKEQLRERQQEPDFHDPVVTVENNAVGPADKMALQVERTPVGTIEDLGLGVYKVSGGYLEKIGLPDYSSLQIGPTSVQRMVTDDGRRGEFTMSDGRKVSLPLAPIEAQTECFDICEISMRSCRQSVLNFLESVKPGSTQGSAS